MKMAVRNSLLLLAATAACSGPADREYELVILNGRVMDPETEFDAVANVGIANGRIETISDAPLVGAREIDASGLVVAPGFIDTHYHAVDRFGSKLAVADGITTGMDLEAGASDVGRWYAAKDSSGWQVNYGTTSSMIGNRMKVHDPEVTMGVPLDASNSSSYVDQSALDGRPGWSLETSDIDQMNQVMAFMDDDLRQGALGIGVGAAYMARGLTSYEQFLAQKTAGAYGRLTSVHTRYHLNNAPPTEAPISLDEVLANALTLQAPLLMAHDNDYGWWENEEKLRLAREQGYNVWGEYYPYAAGSTIVSADFLRPESWVDQLGNTYEETVYDPGQDKFLSRQEYEQMVREAPGYFIVVSFPWRDDWMRHWLTIPEMVVASDAMQGVNAAGELLPYEADVSEYAGHPRTAGTFSTTIKMAREADVPLMFTLAQLSYWTAKHLGDTGLQAMQERGRVQEGMVADLVLFDHEAVEPRSTYKVGENGLPPEGIPYVIINGVVVKDDGEVLDIRPGQPIRFPVEAAGRYEPVTTDGWLSTNTITDRLLPASDDTGLGRVAGGEEGR